MFGGETVSDRKNWCTGIFGELCDWDTVRARVHHAVGKSNERQRCLTFSAVIHVRNRQLTSMPLRGSTR